MTKDILLTYKLYLQYLSYIGTECERPGDKDILHVLEMQLLDYGIFIKDKGDIKKL